MNLTWKQRQLRIHRYHDHYQHRIFSSQRERSNVLTQDIIFENLCGDDGEEASGTEKDNGLCYYDDGDDNEDNDDDDDDNGDDNDDDDDDNDDDDE